jgi:hypothetical protein
VEEQREDAKETGADPALILSALVEVTDMTWYPLREVPPIKEFR